ncbi:MAG: methylated-DNA--[protein]-cysteine S-methyltransferase [Pseudomonadota bacterium]|jgi:methylated-DNA-[protein]-cysteine S-methyltransferase
MIEYCEWRSPLGTMLLAANDDGLYGAYFVGQKHFPRLDEHWRRGEAEPLARARRQLEEYFAGRRQCFSLPLVPWGTLFQRRVWRALAQVAYGATVSYGELARRLGEPGTARAVGAAAGRNPLALFIPCHRAVGSDGALTGYAGGIERKRALLKLERGVVLQAGRSEPCSVAPSP